MTTAEMQAYTPEQLRRVQMGPIRGPTWTNSLARWCLAERRDVRADYRELIELGLISDNCEWVFDVAEVSCGRAITALKYRWLLEVVSQDWRLPNQG